VVDVVSTDIAISSRRVGRVDGTSTPPGESDPARGYVDF